MGPLPEEGGTLPELIYAPLSARRVSFFLGVCGSGRRYPGYNRTAWLICSLRAVASDVANGMGRRTKGSLLLGNEVLSAARLLPLSLGLRHSTGKMHNINKITFMSYMILLTDFFFVQKFWRGRRVPQKWNCDAPAPTGRHKLVR